jgi:UDP-glucose 4-epimerase
VTGGAGYIGSVVAQQLIDEGHDVTIVDNLTSGHRAALPQGARFVEGDVRDKQALRKAFSAGIEGVLHFAALSIVPESVKHPLDYFDNNVGGSIQMLETMRAMGIRRFVFSSTAAVYGEPTELPISESASTQPTNPYGQSKLFVEKILAASRHAWGLDYVALRYFNAAGSTDLHGEHHDPETHLIPIVLDVAAGRRDKLTIYGDDYDTSDGTCLRDYIHVTDLASAHVLALGAMEKGFCGALNLGSAKGFTVLEVMQTVERVTGRPVAHEIGPRRPGDPHALLAASKKAEDTLGWKKTCSSIKKIIQSAHDWRLAHPQGYAD